jgi:hypothetical protein
LHFLDVLEGCGGADLASPPIDLEFKTPDTFVMARQTAMPAAETARATKADINITVIHIATIGVGNRSVSVNSYDRALVFPFGAWFILCGGLPSPITSLGLRFPAILICSSSQAIWLSDGCCGFCWGVPISHCCSIIPPGILKEQAVVGGEMPTQAIAPSIIIAGKLPIIAPRDPLLLAAMLLFFFHPGAREPAYINPPLSLLLKN